MFIQLHSPLRYRRDRERKLALQKPRLIFQSRGCQGSGPPQKTHQRPSYGLVFSTRSQKPRAGRPQAAPALRRYGGRARSRLAPIDRWDGRRWIRDRRAAARLWTARAMQGPTRPQPLSLSQPSTSIYPLTSCSGPAG